MALPCIRAGAPELTHWLYIASLERIIKDFKEGKTSSCELVNSVTVLTCDQYAAAWYRASVILSGVKK